MRDWLTDWVDAKDKIHTLDLTEAIHGDPGAVSDQ